MAEANAVAGAELVAGAIVMLKSGGPNMTIEHTYIDSVKDGTVLKRVESAFCSWFDKHQRITGGFGIESLMISPKE